MAGYIDDIEVKDVRIIFGNFSGKERNKNPKGSRNFCLILPTEELALKMQEEGWNIKRYVNEEKQRDYYYVPVAVRYDNRPPRIVMYNEDESSKVYITEETVRLLDEIDINRFDVVIHPYRWGEGVKAYLKRMKVWVPNDEYDYCLDCSEE